MTHSHIIILTIGVVSMAPVMLLTNRYYKLPVWKIAASLVILTGMAFLSCRLLYWVENGSWGGQSFFGAVLLAPLMTWITAKLLRVPYPCMMDLYSPSVCIMLAVQKINCMVKKCCIGRIFLYAANGDPIRFPSQIAESSASLLICLLLFWLLDNEKYKGKLLACYMVMYGAVRFCLNFLRDTTAIWAELSFGNIWAIASIIVGGTLFLIQSRFKQSCEIKGVSKS